VLRLNWSNNYNSPSVTIRRMSIDQIVRELEEERNRIDRAIQVLREVRSGPIFNRAATKPVSPATRHKISGPREMSASARRRISLAQKARWAKVRAGKK
jgi:hypothetical protein